MNSVDTELAGVQSRYMTFRMFFTVLIQILCMVNECPKISNTLCHTYMPNFFFSFFMHLFHRLLDGKANSVDPDQTAPEGAV